MKQQVSLSNTNLEVLYILKRKNKMTEKLRIRNLLQSVSL